MSDEPLRVLVVGGYGVFGGRLVELLEPEPRVELLVAGRSLPAAEAFCSRPNALAKLVPTRFDRAGDCVAQLTALKPSLVVDASGPFQVYGQEAYRLVEACIACGCNYVDLADGAAFVDGIDRFDDAARAAGVFVLGGVSSYPVLTAAVVRRLSPDLVRIDSIRAGIAPSPHAVVGINVIRAIASYAGQPTPIRRGGAASIGWPFAESDTRVVAVPGRIPLGQRRFSLVDVPDLRVLPRRWPDVADVWVGAAPVPAPLHRMLSLFAWLVRIRILPSLLWMAPLMHAVTSRVRWGPHRGGMFVEVRGRRASGDTMVRQWNLLAEGDDGPRIPCMGILAVVRRVLAGDLPKPGARAATDDVELAEYEAIFADCAITSGVHEASIWPQPLYRRLLGPAWKALPVPIRDLHAVDVGSTFVGASSVETGNGLARLVGRLIGFPVAGNNQPTTVNLLEDGDEGGERWIRTIGRRTFSSIQRAGSGRREGLLRERFGPVTVDLALVVEGGTLRYVLRAWAFCGVPMPRWLGPRSTAVESVADGVFRFEVEVAHPLTGLIVRYRGSLRRAS